MTTSGPPDETALARAFRQDGGRVLAALIRQFGDFDLAEDALAEAFSRAARHWAETGTPRNPGAWLLTVARRLAIDRLRKSARQSREDMQQAVVDLETDRREAGQDHAIPDDRLRLIFTCCHPALAPEAQLALTLKTLGGLSIGEIARAFLISPSALARRLTRAKTKIRDTGIRYQVPEGPDLARRLPRVLEVIYLIYNESYLALEGETLTRADLAEEAIRLARLVHDLLPHPETEGLLALILLHDARRAARSADTNMLVPLEHQDRNLWDRDKAENGRAHLLHALALKRPGPYQIQAAISAVHLDAPNWGATDWVQIAGLYRALETMMPTDVVRLNRAVALTQIGDLETAEALMAALAEPLSLYQPFFAARAEFHRRKGDITAAEADLQKAISLSSNSSETLFLKSRLTALTDRA